MEYTTIGPVSPELAAAMAKTAMKKSNGLSASTIADLVFGLSKSESKYDSDVMSVLLVPTIIFFENNFRLRACAGPHWLRSLSGASREGDRAL
jgi:hypothetical protein